MAICEVKVIGVVRMSDKGKMDDKILSVHAKDPRFGEWNTINDIPQHYLKELRHFLETYKELQGIKTKVYEILGQEEAYKDIEKALMLYKQKFDGKLFK